jgi:hypothetical protein
MKNLLIFLLLGLFSCIQEPEVLPRNREIFKNGDFMHPYKVNLDIFNDCKCAVNPEHAYYSEPLAGIDVAYVMISRYAVSATDSTILHRNYYTGEILTICKTYKFEFYLYDVSVDNLRVYQGEELLQTFYPNDQIKQSITFVATSCNLKFSGTTAVGKLSIRESI